MVMGDSGIFSKANQAKNKTEVAQYEEELRMCVLEIQTDEATKGTTFGIDTIRKNLVEKVKELENTEEIEITSPEGNATIEGTYKGYEYKIDEKYVVHIGDKATGIILKTSLEPKGWTNQNVKATITIKSNNGINKVEPDEGSKNGNEYIITKENITENTSFEYTVTDGQGNTQTKTAVINTIDKNPPADFTIAAENTEEGLRITGEATDAESGINRYEYYVKKSTDSDYTKYDSNPITGLASGTYNVYAIAYDKAGNKKQSTNTVENVKISASYSNVTAQMVAEHPETYYGLKVTNYESQNGQNDWKIFYSDWKEKNIEQNTENPTDTHIFLITGDYINTEDTNRISSETGMRKSKYNAYWYYYAPNFQTVDPTVITRFKAVGYPLQNEIENSKCVSTLLNSNNWISYLDEEINGKRKSEYAIGSPTVEMWMDSWNNLYENKDGKLYWKAGTDTSKPGYYVGTSSSPSTHFIDAEVMNKREGSNNNLYYLHTGSNNGTEGYWLASPSVNISNSILNVREYGTMYFSNFGTDCLGLRPVVCLTSGITVNAEEAE